MITSIIKLLIVAIGFLSTIGFSIAGLRGSSTGYKKAGFSLILTFLLISVTTVIEQRLYSENLKNRKLVLTASREAPIGGIWLKLYNDSTYVLTYDPRSKGIKGIYKTNGDIITLFNADKIKASFTVKKGVLEEVGRTGIGSLRILTSN